MLILFARNKKNHKLWQQRDSERWKNLHVSLATVGDTFKCISKVDGSAIKLY